MLSYSSLHKIEIKVARILKVITNDSIKLKDATNTEKENFTAPQ